MQNLRLQCRRLDPGLPLPRHARPGDAGVDLYARHDVTLMPGMRHLMPTGIAIAVPPGWVGLVHPRSGLSIKHGVTVVNAPGTIDSGYRGEIMVPLINVDPSQPFAIRRGDRVAQLLVQRYAPLEFEEVDELPVSQRGDTGFGDTGGFGVGDPVG